MLSSEDRTKVTRLTRGPEGMKRGSFRHEGLYGLSLYHLDRSFVLNST
jgi:hypothetical protein